MEAINGEQMTNRKEPGPCPFLGNRDYVPAGPPGKDLEAWDLETTAGGIELKSGQRLKIDGSWVVLRKIRRCQNGEIYGMHEYPDGGILWSQLAPAPVPELTEWQKNELKDIETRIPRQFWVLGDMSRKIGDRTGLITAEGSRSGTVLFMASTRPFTAGAVIAMDDGGMRIGDDVMALLDGRVKTHTSEQR